LAQKIRGASFLAFKGEAVGVAKIYANGNGALQTEFFLSLLDLDEPEFENIQTPTKQYNFSKANFTDIIKYLNDLNWDNLFVNADVDECVKIFYDQLNYCIDSFLPVFRAPPCKKRHPWQTRELVNLENKITKAFKKGRTNQFKFLRNK
jgi:hypothetical protein